MWIHICLHSVLDPFLLIDRAQPRASYCSAPPLVHELSVIYNISHTFIASQFTRLSWEIRYTYGSGNTWNDTRLRPQLGWLEIARAGCISARLECILWIREVLSVSRTSTNSPGQTVLEGNLDIFRNWYGIWGDISYPSKVHCSYLAETDSPQSSSIGQTALWKEVAISHPCLN